MAPLSMTFNDLEGYFCCLKTFVSHTSGGNTACIIYHLFTHELETGTIFSTRNTFCGTWYLPHSRVHSPWLHCAYSNKIPYPLLWCRDVHLLLKNIKWIL